MKYLSIILVFSGYVLIYSAVAKQGHFATEPWASLFSDAYIEPVFGKPGETPQQNAAAIQQAVNQTPGAIPVQGPVSALTSSIKNIFNAAPQQAVASFGGA